MLTFKGVAIRPHRFGRALTGRQIAAGLALKEALEYGVQLDRPGIIEYVFAEHKRVTVCHLFWYSSLSELEERQRA